MEIFSSKTYVTVVSFLAFMTLTLAIIGRSDDKTPAVPDAIALHIRNVQLDASQQKNLQFVLQQQFNASQEAVNKDEKELQTLIDDAVKTAGLDKDKWTVDLQTLKFIARPSAPKGK